MCARIHALGSERGWQSLHIYVHFVPKEINKVSNGEYYYPQCQVLGPPQHALVAFPKQVLDPVAYCKKMRALVASNQVPVLC